MEDSLLDHAGKDNGNRRKVWNIEESLKEATERQKKGQSRCSLEDIPYES